MFCRDHYESDLGFRSKSYSTHYSLKQPCKCEMYFTRKRRRGGPNSRKMILHNTSIKLHCCWRIWKRLRKNMFRMRLHISAPLFCNSSLANSHLCKIILLSDKHYPNTEYIYSRILRCILQKKLCFRHIVHYKYPGAKKLLQLKKNYETGDPNSQVFATLTKWPNKVFPILPFFPS